MDHQIIYCYVGHYSPLIDDLVAQAHLRDGPTIPNMDDQAFQAFNDKLLSGWIRAACRNVTS